MSNTDFEKAMILYHLSQIDEAFNSAKQTIEIQKQIGFMTPKTAESFIGMFGCLIKLQSEREKLVCIANEVYGMNIR